MYSYHLVLFVELSEMYELWLPKIPEGFFRFAENPEYRFLSFIGREGQWRAVCNAPAFFRNVPMDQSCDMPLVNGQLIEIDYDDRKYVLYIQEVSSYRMKFCNYFVCSEVSITIGNDVSNDIYFNNPYISQRHAVLTRTDGEWQIRDCGSVYGMYVNGKKQASSKLKLGDIVYIMGLRIIIGINFISVNDEIGTVLVNPKIIQNELVNHSSYSHYYGQGITETTTHYFNRLPRKRFDVPERTITVEGPPMSMDQKQMPLMLRMGSSMVMGGTAALAGNFTSLLSSFLFPMLSSRYTNKQRQEYEQLRYAKYTEYLEMKRNEIASACEEEKRILNYKYPTIADVIELSTQTKHLWERRPVDTDFLQVRIGTGKLPLTAKVDYPVKRFQLEMDELENEMYRLVESDHLVENIPVVLSLTETLVCGLQGTHKKKIEYIKKLVLQIALFHSYDEVKMAFLLNKDDLLEMDSIRYLPHVWDDQRSIRFIATNEAEAYSLGEYIKTHLVEEKCGEKDLKQILKNRPYYLIFVLDKKLFDSHEVLKEIVQFDSNHGISVVTACEDLPKECQKIIALDATGKNVFTTMMTNGGEDVIFHDDNCDRGKMSQAMRKLANIRLRTIAQTQEIPKKITFLEMYKTGRIEQLNSLKRWKENNPVNSLAVPVGVGADGSIFTLDLHEKRQGPHGLVAGMTGSGKSEFIITYILSMAVNYHPDEVAFVLIDYKGGGLAGAFENLQTGVRLPHLVGTITNLDGASVQRSLMSIESELIHRQKIFSEIKSTVNEGTMDIYAYQKLYRAGRVSEPMPHLFIISDEFAELKQQQPEFMAKLVSAARIGRSLGVHLILATQKPSGVVDDQIRSNTKFRVCLRVQERSDSMDMLKRPEAAELTDTGRFYLQVGYNEYFALGQSAWCGAAYEPQDTVMVQRDDAIEFLDIAGQTVSKASPKVKKVDSGTKQIVAIVKYLSEIADIHGIKARQLWQPELPKKLDLDILQREKQTGLNEKMSVCLGKLDDPENQQQVPLIVNFGQCQNLLIVGDSGSGKTTLVQNILYSLIDQLTPQEFNFYVLDYSSRMMKLFKPLPHCGVVLCEEDVESLDEFFKLINSLVAERKQLFSELEVDTFEAARSLKSIPLILIVIDNIAGLTSSKLGEAHSYKLQSYLKNSASYGIKYIVTCSHLNEVSSRIRQELAERICLHMKDKYDYGEMLGCKVTYVPPEVPGRGLYKWDERPLEFQGAVIKADGDEKNRNRYIKEIVEQLCARYGNQAEAKGLPVFSETATYEEFSRQFSRGRIPLGYSQKNHKPVALPLKQFSALSIYIGNPLGIKPLTENLIHAAKREKMEVWVIQRRDGSLFDNNDEKWSENIKIKVFSLEKESLTAFRSLLTTQIAERNNVVQEFCSQNGFLGEPKEIYMKTFEHLRKNTTPVLLIVENFADFCGSVDPISAMVYDKAFSLAQRRNIYVIGCFEPNDYERVESRMLYYGFNPEAHILMLGGNFDKQKICAFSKTEGLNKILPYNSGLMSYHNGFYPILMPCGELSFDEEDEDEQSIF